jgi:K+/H+ antiporter YhaU regulatory subunit KhtT
LPSNAERDLQPGFSTQLRERSYGRDDVLLADVHMSEEGANQFWHSQMLEPRPLSETGNYFVDRSQEIGAAEVILPAESRLIGRTVLEARVRSEYGLTVIGLRHGSKVVAHGLPERG